MSTMRSSSDLLVVAFLTTLLLWQPSCVCPWQLTLSEELQPPPPPYYSGSADEIIGTFSDGSQVTPTFGDTTRDQYPHWPHDPVLPTSSNSSPRYKCGTVAPEHRIPMEIYWKQTDSCHTLLTRGPCEEGEIFYYDPWEKFLACQVNPCDAENFILWEDRKCYQLGLLGRQRPSGYPCSGRCQTLAFSDVTLEVECVVDELCNPFPGLPQPAYSLLNLAGRPCHNVGAGTAYDLACNGRERGITFLQFPAGASTRSCRKGQFFAPNGKCVEFVPFNRKRRLQSSAPARHNGPYRVAVRQEDATELRTATPPPSNAGGTISEDNNLRATEKETTFASVRRRQRPRRRWPVRPRHRQHPAEGPLRTTTSPQLRWRPILVLLENARNGTSLPIQVSFRESD